MGRHGSACLSPRCRRAPHAASQAADAMEPLRQDVQYEAPDEVGRGHGHGLVARRSFNPVILDLERHALWGRRSRERAPGSTASNSAAYVDALRDGTRVAWNRWINTHVPDVHQRLTENGHETQMAPVLCSCSFCAGTCDR